MRSSLWKGLFLLFGSGSFKLIVHFQHGIHLHCRVLMLFIFIVVGQKYWFVNFRKCFFGHGRFHQLLKINGGFETVFAIPVTTNL